MKFKQLKATIRQAGFYSVAVSACVFSAGSAKADTVSQVIPWTGIPIHMALTPDGQILTFGSTVDGAQGGLNTLRWNPKQGTGPASRVLFPNQNNFDSFCIAGVLEAASGNTLLAGGFSNQLASEYRFTTQSVNPTYTMAYPRYYATATTLPDGRIHMQGGSPKYGNQVNSSPISEVLTPGKGWAQLPGTANGPQRRGDPVATGNPFWYPHTYPVRGTEVFTIAGKYTYFENYSGAGSIRNETAFNGTNYGASSAGLMIRPGVVMQLGGGAESSAPSPHVGSNVATIFDLRGVDSAGRTTVTRRDTYMRLGRHWPTGTLLPTGEVLVTGGSATNNVVDAGVAYDSEIYDPNTGIWRTGARISVPRLYHSAALLLKDGRVLVGGGGAPGPIVGTNVEIYTPDYLARAGGVRPSITAAPNRVALGQTIKVVTDTPIVRMTWLKTGTVTHSFNTDQRFFEAAFVPVVGGYNVTFPNDKVNATPGMYMLFAFDVRGVPSEGKFIRLPNPIADNNWNIPNDLPTSKAPPLSDAVATRWETCAGEGGLCTTPTTRRVRYGANGSYYSREIDGARPLLCNVATFGGDPAVGVYKTCQYEVPLLQADNEIGFTPDEIGSYLQSYKIRHANFQGYLSSIDGSGSDVDWNTSRWLVRPGLADPACFSFTTTDWPGYYLRHSNFGIRLDAADGLPSYTADATWCARAPLNGRAVGGAVSFESKNYPGYFLRHENYVMELRPNDGGAVFKEVATFSPVNARKAMADGQVVNFEPYSQPGYRIRHANYLGYISYITKDSVANDQNGSAWIVHPGLGDATCKSFESIDQPGHYLRHINYRLNLSAPDGNPTFNQDSTFCPRPNLMGRSGGQAVSLQPLNYPGYYIIHKNYELYIAPDDGTPQFKDVATFIPSPR